MNAKHRKTLAAIFANPIARNIQFRDIEALLLALGCHVREGDGSRVAFVRDGLIWPTQRPHPQKEAQQYQVKDVRFFLTGLGVSHE